MDWLAIRSNFAVGRAVPMEVERGGERVQFRLQPETRDWNRLVPEEWTLRIILAIAQGITLLLALGILFLSPSDRVASLAAAFLAAIGAIYFETPYGFASALRKLPDILVHLHWIPFVSTLALGPLAFAFFFSLSRARPGDPRLSALLWVPWVLIAAPLLVQHAAIVYRPERVTDILSPSILAAYVSVSLGYLAAGVALLWIRHRRLEDPNQRRRIRIVLLGSAVGIFSMFPVAALLLSGRVSGRFARALLSAPGRLVTAALFLVFPASFAYAILRHRLFDIRLILRRGIQAALTQGFLVALPPALGGMLVLDLFVHRDKAIRQVLPARGWVYFVLLAFAIGVASQRKRWLEALDRRLFPDRHESGRLLKSCRRSSG
jgi:hypothetical protein